MPPRIVSVFDTDDFGGMIADASQMLRDGKIVVLPTETVYGAAGVLNQAAASGRLKALRSGRDGKPFTIHVSDPGEALQYLGEVGAVGSRMMRKLWPGPVALQFAVPEARRKEISAKFGVDERELYDGDICTLRCPADPIAASVLARVDAPVGLVAVDNSDFPALGAKVDLVLDAGPTRYSKPSTMIRVKGEKYEIVRAGIYDERIIERLLKTMVLFVCSGNTCRSPMAEALARKILAKKLSVTESELENKGISVISAGSFAMPGSHATPAGVEALSEMGIDLSKHRSRPLSVELIHQADVIFTMGKNHALAVTTLVPSASGRTSTLNPDGDIDDPIGGDVELYRKLAKDLERLIEKRLNEIDQKLFT